MNRAKTEKRLVKGIKGFFKKSGKSKAVVGLSGGIDSALVLALLVKALGSDNVTSIMMPDTRVTKEQNVIDAENLSERLEVKHFVVEIDDIVSGFSELPWVQSELARANLIARVRGVILYNYANSSDCLVAGTGNKSEFFMGYFTKYGDAAADFFPIGALLKSQVRELAIHLRLPKVFLEKVPSAELWLGQEDEKELGLTYDVLDELLPLVLSKKKVPRVNEAEAKKIARIIGATAHKREPPPIIQA